MREVFRVPSKLLKFNARGSSVFDERDSGSEGYCAYLCLKVSIYLFNICRDTVYMLYCVFLVIIARILGLSSDNCDYTRRIALSIR